MFHEHYDQIVSRHFFRRRARANLAWLRESGLPDGWAYWVNPAKRGPYRFYVVRARVTDPSA